MQYVKDNFWPGRMYTDIADLNRQAIAWCRQVDQRIHGTTGERPCDRIKDENLLPLPAPDRLMKFLRVERMVSLKAAEGALKPMPLARETVAPQVEQRPLALYDALAEVASC